MKLHGLGPGAWGLGAVILMFCACTGPSTLLTIPVPTPTETVPLGADDGSAEMCQNAVVQGGFDELEARLAEAILGMGSPEELEAWLQTQPCVVKATMQDYWLKTSPPQRVYHLTFRLEDGSTRDKVLSVYQQPDGTLTLGRMYDP